MAYEKIESHDDYLKIVEKYQDYEAGNYQSMTLEEKMNFFDGINKNQVPLFDEDGDDMETSDDYYAIRDEFLEHPEQFSLNHLLDFMKMLDDNCDQPSFMDTTIKIIRNIACHYQLEGVTYLLSHLHEVPDSGYQCGLLGIAHCLANDDTVYPLVREALTQISPRNREFVLQLLGSASKQDTEGE